MLIELTDEEIALLLLALDKQRKAISHNRHSDWENRIVEARQLQAKIEKRWNYEKLEKV